VENFEEGNLNEENVLINNDKNIEGDEVEMEVTNVVLNEKVNELVNDDGFEKVELTKEEKLKGKLESGQKHFTVEKCFEKREKFRFDLSIQRNQVWKSDKKSLFIHSMLLGYPLASIYTMSQESDNYYWVLDGKQRLTTFFDFIENKFTLDGNDLGFVNGEDVTGKQFADLSNDLKNELLATKVSVINFKNLSVDQRDQLFFRLNNGESLSKMEQTRALSGKFMNEVVNTLETDLFKEKLRMNEKSRQRFKDVEVVIQTLLLLENENESDFKGLGSLAIREYVQNKKSFDENGEVFSRLYKVLGYLEVATQDIDKKHLKIFKKSNVPVIVSVAEKFKDRNMKASLFGESLVTFFIEFGPNEDGEYLLLLKAGSSKKENVLRRSEILERYMMKQMMKVTDGSSEFKVS
jgi:hypothetical protein